MQKTFLSFNISCKSLENKFLLIFNLKFMAFQHCWSNMLSCWRDNLLLDYLFFDFMSSCSCWTFCNLIERHTCNRTDGWTEPLDCLLLFSVKLWIRVSTSIWNLLWSSTPVSIPVVYLCIKIYSMHSTLSLTMTKVNII